MYFCFVLCIVCFVSFSELFVCICVLKYCYRVVTQLQLNISYHIISCIIKPSWPSPQTQTQVPLLLQGQSPSEFQQDPLRVSSWSWRVQQLEDTFKFSDVRICTLRRADRVRKELLTTRRPKSGNYCIKYNGDTSQGSTHIPSREQMRRNADINSTVPCHMTK